MFGLYDCKQCRRDTKNRCMGEAKLDCDLRNDVGSNVMDCNYKQILGMTLRPHQLDYVTCSAKIKIIHWGRRLGASTAICAEALMKMINKPRHKILIAAPLRAQSRLLFDTMAQLINNKEHTRACVRRFLETSSYIELENGSSVYFEHIKSRHGSIGHGMNVNSLYLDCANFMSDMTLLPLLFNCYDTTGTFIISGPMKNEKVREMVYNPHYKYFHVPATIVWSKEQIDEARELMTDEEFYREVMCEIGK